MISKLSQNQVFSLDVASRINEFCKSFNAKSLIHFMHDITFGHGQISMLMNDKNALAFYFKHKIPAICTDETGRTIDAGIYLGKVLREYYQDAAVIMPQLPFAKNSIHICVRDLNYQQLYSLYFDLSEMEFLQWVINNGNLINDFIAYYKVNMQDLIEEAMLEENRMVLPIYSSYIKEKPIQVKLNHKITHMPIYLASQQSICFKHLLEGKTAKQIAKTMALSNRTVEHYLARIRKILGCTSNHDLISSYAEQWFNQK